MPFRCTVLTPERLAFEGEVESAVLPAHDGELGILPGHADFLGELGVGCARLRQAGSEEVLAVNGGYLRVSAGSLTVLAEEAVAAEAVDRAAAEADLKAALAERSGGHVAWARARLRLVG